MYLLYTSKIETPQLSESGVMGFWDSQDFWLHPSFVNLHAPGGSTLRRGRPAELLMDYGKYADDEGNLYYVENNKSEREDSG